MKPPGISWTQKSQKEHHTTTRIFNGSLGPNQHNPDASPLRYVPTFDACFTASSLSATSRRALASENRALFSLYLPMVFFSSSENIKPLQSYKRSQGSSRNHLVPAHECLQGCPREGGPLEEYDWRAKLETSHDQAEA
jgi:hypothetical protein